MLPLYFRRDIVMKKTFVVMIFAVIALMSMAHAADAQRTTRLYGSAYQQMWTGLFWTYTPYATVFISDQYGNHWTAKTNWRSDWWLDNMPTNRYYSFQAQSIGWNWRWSQTTRVWVPERPWWQLNQTRIEDLICR
jgi:hypothetical protein